MWVCSYRCESRNTLDVDDWLVLRRELAMVRARPPPTENPMVKTLSITDENHTFKFQAFKFSFYPILECLCKAGDSVENPNFRALDL